MKLQNFVEDRTSGAFTSDQMIFEYTRSSENENSPHGSLQMEFLGLLDLRGALKRVVDYTEFVTISPAKKEKCIVHLINGEASKEKIRQAIKDEKIEDEKKN